MGNLLTFLELAAVALWFGGAVTRGSSADRLRPLFLICAATLAVVVGARGLMWVWTPLHSLSLGLIGAAGLATRWWARWPGMTFGLFYLGWVAWRGY
jgi:hypothetical protein